MDLEQTKEWCDLKESRIFPSKPGECLELEGANFKLFCGYFDSFEINFEVRNFFFKF